MIGPARLGWPIGEGVGGGDGRLFSVPGNDRECSPPLAFQPIAVTGTDNELSQCLEKWFLLQSLVLGSGAAGAAIRPYVGPDKRLLRSHHFATAVLPPLLCSSLPVTSLDARSVSASSLSLPQYMITTCNYLFNLHIYLKYNFYICHYIFLLYHMFFINTSLFNCCFIFYS